MSVCYGCFKEYEGQGPCTHCGFDISQQQEKYPLALKPGTILDGRYILGRVLGQGGFGITYCAQEYDSKKMVAIKEFMPETLATRINHTTVKVFSAQYEQDFEYGKNNFLAEAKTISQFNGQNNICDIYSYFEENGTAYFAMEYVEGIGLDRYMNSKGGKLSFEEAKQLLMPIMRALGNVHAKGIIHRDISPDNIMVKSDGSVMLIDFGAARYSLGEKSRSLDVVLKHGFAPKEQYSRHGRQGAYTDVYAMAATFYYVITGKIPPESIDRMSNDELIMPSTLGAKISQGAEDVLMQALSVEPENRFQSMWDFASALEQEKAGTLKKNESKTQGGSSALLQRARLYLESSDWKSAAEYYERVLDMEPENAVAYLGKLLSQLHLNDIEQLKTSRKAFIRNPNFLLAQRFAEPVLKAKLEEYAAEAEKSGAKFRTVIPKSEKKSEKPAKTVKQPKAEKPAVEKKPLPKKLIAIAASAAAVLLALILFLGSGPKTHGVSGDVEWNFETETGLLRISGIGKMEDYGKYGSKQSPWLEGGWAKDIKSLEIESGVTHIGEDAFRACTGLKSVSFPDSLMSIGNSAFENCNIIKSIEIPDGCSSIGMNCFAECYSLKSLYLPTSIDYIGIYAFSHCKSLSSVTVPEGVEKLEQGAFYGCSSLRELYLPRSLEEIPYSLAEYTPSLVSINYAGSYADWAKMEMGESNENLSEIQLICDGRIEYGPEPKDIADAHGKLSEYISWEYDSNSRTLSINGEGEMNDWEINENYFEETLNANSAWHNKKIHLAAENVIVGEGITYIGDYSFAEFEFLSSVSLPDSLKEIGEGAFASCKALETIGLPENLEIIGAEVFEGDYSLSIIQLPEKLESIGSSAFMSCYSLTRLELPASLKKIGSYCFSGCYSLQLVMPETFTYGCEIRDWAFNKLYSMESLVLPERTSHIGLIGLVESCKSLEKLYIPYSVETIYYSVESSLKDTFEGNSSLKEIVFSGEKKQWNSLTKEIELPKNVTVTFGDRSLVHVEDVPMPTLSAESEQKAKPVESKSSAKAETYLAEGYKYKESKDYKQAVENFSMAASMGNGEAMYQMAIAYRNGYSVEKDWVKALEWYEKSADNGYADALAGIGNLYRQGQYGINKNMDTAIEYYYMAVEQGSAMGMHNIAYAYWTGEGLEKDINKCIEWYEKAIELDYDASMNNLAMVLASDDNPNPDYARAVELYEMAIEKGIDSAMNNLGMLYKNGKGVERDVEKAFELFEMGAELGNSACVLNLGLMYCDGSGVEKDLKKGLELLEEAKRLGSTTAEDWIKMYSK